MALFLARVVVVIFLGICLPTFSGVRLASSALVFFGMSLATLAGEVVFVGGSERF